MVAGSEKIGNATVGGSDPDILRYLEEFNPSGDIALASGDSSDIVPPEIPPPPSLIQAR